MIQKFEEFHSINEDDKALSKKYISEAKEKVEQLKDDIKNENPGRYTFHVKGGIADIETKFKDGRWESYIFHPKSKGIKVTRNCKISKLISTAEEFEQDVIDNWKLS